MIKKLKNAAGVIDPFIVIMLGLVGLASVLPVRGQAAVVADIVTDAAIVLLFFLHGATLIGLLMQVSLSGIIAPMILSGFLFLTLLPSTVQSSIAFTGIARGNVAAAVCAASLSNVLGIFLTPLMVGLFMGATSGVSMAAIEKITLQLLLPFVLGHLARPLLAGFIAKHKTLVGRVDRTSILLVVYTAFSASVVEGLWSKVSAVDLISVLILCAVVLAVVLWGTWFISGRLGFAREDRVVILFCGSKKSLASGVPMASTLFPAAMLGPVILPLMLFHQIQLIVCAFIAQKMKSPGKEEH
jgi:solute carrier family 10 (sodium/bile acid cotransporter), member 7